MRSMITPGQRDMVIIGASLPVRFAAATAATSGVRTMVIDRDVLRRYPRLKS